jgi:hypothetical protein
VGTIFPNPEGKNDLNSKDMFEERLRYKRLSFNSYDPVPLDMIYEKPFYGKVDFSGYTIYPTEINMEQLPGAGLQMVHDFVHAAFVDFRNDCKWHMNGNTARFSDLFANGLTPKSATKNVHRLYQDHFVKSVYEPFINNYMIGSGRMKRVQTFQQFVESFVSYAAEVKDVLPVTRTGFIMSPLCPHAISGLIIDLETIARDDDNVKYENYISKPEFRDYVRLAASYGFYVDKNCPWRLAVNLDHPRMTQKYMPSFGTSYEDGAVFNDYFLRSEFFSYDDFKVRMWRAYQQLLVDADTTSGALITAVKNCYSPHWADIASINFKTTVQEGFLQTISEDFEGDFQTQFPDEFFLPFYFKIRLSESNKRMNIRKYKVKINNILKANKIKGLQYALDLMERMIMPSEIYVANKNQTYPRRIEYFGKNITSGLHSYKGYDNVSSEAIVTQTKITYD